MTELEELRPVHPDATPLEDWDQVLELFIGGSGYEGADPTTGATTGAGGARQACNAVHN